jgi:hypothetical protein
LGFFLIKHPPPPCRPRLGCIGGKVNQQGMTLNE